MATVGWILHKGMGLTLSPKSEYRDSDDWDATEFLESAIYPHSFKDNFDKVVATFLKLKHSYIAPTNGRGVDEKGERFAVVVINETICLPSEVSEWIDGDYIETDYATVYTIKESGIVMTHTFVDGFGEAIKLYDPDMKSPYDLRTLPERDYSYTKPPAVNGSMVKSFLSANAA